MFKPLIGLVRKEFIQIFRDSNMLRIIFVVPVIQLLLFGYVVNIEVKEIALDVYDFDRSVDSRELVNRLGATDYFIPNKTDLSILAMEDQFKKTKSDMALVIPEDFSEKLTNHMKPKISLITDGSDANSTAIGTGYLQQILLKYTMDYYNIEKPLDLKVDVRYNPEAESVYFMVPGIVATLLTMVTVMLTSMAVVRELEVGTLEQILVTPMTKLTFLMGKIIPFAILGLFEISVALTIGVLWFKIPFVGSPLLLFITAGIYLMTTLGMGLFFSNVTSTQQQAMFFAWFFSVFAIITSGFFTPISNMPHWMQYITYLNPMRYFMDIVRAIMMKGAGIAQIHNNVIALIIFGLVVFSFSVMRFSKRTA